MRVEQERCNTKRNNRDPEVDEPIRPERQCHIKQHNQRSESEIDTWPSEPREQDTKVDPRSRKSTSRSDISSTTKCQVAQDRVSINLGGKDLKDRRKGTELFSQTENGFPCTTFNEFCKITYKHKVATKPKQRTYLARIEARTRS